MIGPEKAALVNEMCQVTQDGPVQQWVERIAAIAKEINLPLHRICWQGSPQIVAFHIIQYAAAWSDNGLSALSEAIKKRKEGVTSET